MRSSKTKKISSVTVYLDVKKESAKLKKAVGPELYAKIRKATCEEMRDIKEHFAAKKGGGGWPLDYWHYKMDILNSALGTDLSAYFMAHIAEAGLNTDYEITEMSKVCGSFVITRPRRKAAK